MKVFNHSPWTPVEMEVQNNETGRWYHYGGEKFESVTSYISRHWDKSGLDEWRKREGESVAAHKSKIATDRGQTLHWGIQHYLENKGVPQYDDDPHDRMLFFKVKPLLDRIDNIRLIEQPLYSNIHKLAGRPDTIAEFDGELSVIDFKTSTKVKKAKYIVSYYLQCGFYGSMTWETYPHAAIHPTKVVIVMATEENPTAQLFTMDMEDCFALGRAFVKDPVAFQVKMKKLQRAFP